MIDDAVLATLARRVVDSRLSVMRSEAREQARSALHRDEADLLSYIEEASKQA